jgi:transcriptional pleiotropic regulator of transition state genes
MESMEKYIRSLDSLGRIELPRKMLKDNLFEDGALFNIKAMPEGILLVPAEGSCALCGGSDYLIDTGQGYICRACIKEAEKKIADN